MSDDKSDIWHVVLFESDHVTRQKVLEYCQQCEAVTLCANENDKDKRSHFHLAHTYAEPVCRSTVRTRLKKNFPELNGKGQYNMHLPKDGQDLNGLYRYICKGTGEVPDVPDNWDGSPQSSCLLKAGDEFILPKIIFNKMWLLHCGIYHKQYYTMQRQFKGETKALAKKIQDEKIKKRNECLAEARLKTFSNRLEIVDFLYRYMEGKIPIHDLTIMVQQIEYRQDPEHSVNLMYQIVNKKLSPF